MMKERALIHLYTGTGKGKTTAAIGMAMRAAGQGFRVCVFQFLKGGDRPGGEMRFAQKTRCGIDFVRFAEAHPMFAEKSGCRKDYKRRLSRRLKADCKIAARRARSGRYDMVVLDEIVNALTEGLISRDDLLGILNARPLTTELVLTGRYAPPEIIDMADYVTEMKDVKHPFRSGIRARKGVEY